MELALALKQTESLTPQEKTEMEQQVQQAIALHQGNAAQINRLVIDSVTALTASESRANELASQGFFKRFLGGITGKNNQLKADINRNLIKSQYASQMLVQKLAEQNLITFDMVTAVNNKLNMLVRELDEEINNIYQTLILFFKQTRSDLIQIESRIEKLERNVAILHWNSTVEYQMYQGKEYSELQPIEKIICLTNDFYCLTKGSWSTGDLMLLKSTLAEVGLPVKEKMVYRDFYTALAERPDLIDRLFQGNDLRGLAQVEAYQAAAIKGVEKLVKLKGEEDYVLDTITGYLDRVQVSYNERELQISIVANYLRSNAFMQIDSEVNIFDFVLDLLFNINTVAIATETIAEATDASTKQSQPEEQYQLGLKYYQGDGVEWNYSEAFNLFQQAEAAGHVPAQTMLGIMYRKGEGIEKDIAQAISHLDNACQCDDPKAYWHRGIIEYIDNDDDDAAFPYFKRAAELDYVSAYQQLGHMYELGLGTEENVQQARAWYEKAAEHNDAEAQNSLGDLYCYGQGVEKNFATAVEYYRQAAQNGDKNGQKNYGDMLILGLGIDEEYKEAEKWYLKSAEQGNAKAAFMLGKLYHFGGNGIPQDYTKAVKWYQKAVEKEHKHALNNLACLYFSGDGVAQDYFEACIKFNEADDEGDEYARENLELLGNDEELWEYSSFAPKAYYITEKV